MCGRNLFWCRITFSISFKISVLLFQKIHFRLRIIANIFFWLALINEFYITILKPAEAIRQAQANEERLVAEIHELKNKSSQERYRFFAVVVKCSNRSYLK